MPNPNTIKWLHYQDIQVQDADIRKQFKAFCAQANFTEALRLLRNNSQQLQGKAYIANTINTIANGIYELEDKFYTNVLVFLSDLGTKWQSLIDGIKNRGQWLNVKDYKKNNFVVYQENVYMALKDVPIGIVPTNTEYWLLLGLRGREGAHGVNVTMRYDWDSITTYQPNDLVVFNNDIYVAFQENTNISPDSSTDNWAVFLHAEKGQIYVGDVPPDVTTQNTIWFQTPINPIKYTGNSPIIGQFNRLVANMTITGEYDYSWEAMYPNVLFHHMDGIDNMANRQIIIDYEIQPTEWANSQWVYKNKAIQDNSLVYIIPQENITDMQYQEFNRMISQVVVNEGQIAIKTNHNITQIIPVRIIIA